jgi:LmbE family N-acetylglucosaminyl deacetylase
VIAPHMDDEVLGCGGAIVRHAELGSEVWVCVCSHRVYNRQFNPEKNAEERRASEEAQAILGYASQRHLDLPDERLNEVFQSLLDGLESIVREFEPEAVYLPFAGDLNQDHRTVAHAANIAVRHSAAPFIRRVLAYEVPSGTEQTFPGTAPPFQPNCYIDVSDVVAAKLSAMAAYERESREAPHPRSPELLMALMAVRGSVVGSEAAEAFMLLRERW